jgi:hypothetical protein
MKTRDNTRVMSAPPNALIRLIVVLAVACSFYTQALAQQTPADTAIVNTATATYSDGSQSYETSSNTVTVTVAKVSGLTITPDTTDGSSDPTVVPGESNVRFNFVVTNTGNFTDDVRFLANGASVQVASGMATVTSAFVDVNGNNTYQAGTDIDINDGVADLVNFTQGQSRTVVVYVNVNVAAPAGSIINVRLGDADNAAPYDNEPVDATTANEVRTESNASVTGRREARGDRSAIVETDAQLALSLTSPTGTGPVALGTNITYVWQLCNTGARAASPVTLANVNGVPAGGETGVFIFAPIPTGTTLEATQVFPAGTLYSDSAVGSNPVSGAQWYATPQATTTRIAFKVGNTLGVGACSANLNQVVTITTTNATNAITQQGNAFARNYINTAQISATSGVWTTLLQMLGDVLNGPQGAPGAVNNNNNDDFTNKSINTGIAGRAPGMGINAIGVATFTNTVQNMGNANDTYTLTVPTYPANSTVKVTVNGIQTTVVNAGTPTGNAITPLSIAYNSTGTYQVEVTLPIGTTVLTGYNTVIRATSANTNTQWNETIDRVYTGFIRLVKTATIINNTNDGNGQDDPGADDAVPGAMIVYAIAYDNVSVAQAVGGSGNVTLTASNIVISEDGDGGTNNWATYTTMVLGGGLDPTDTNGGVITDGDTVNSPVGPGTSFLKDTIASLAPEVSGVFTFRRLIK